MQGDERLTIPLVFQLARDLPEEINTITLVYTLYPVERAVQNAALMNTRNASLVSNPHYGLNNNKAAGEKI